MNQQIQQITCNKLNSNQNIPENLWGKLVPIQQQHSQINLTNELTYLGFEDEEYENLKQLKSFEENQNYIFKIYYNSKMSESKIQLTNENVELAVFDNKLDLNQIQKICDGDVFYIHYKQSDKYLKIGYVLLTLLKNQEMEITENINQDTNEIKNKEEESKQSIEEIIEENKELKKRICKIKALDENFENELNCPVCLEIMYKPYTVISCLHNFCGDCLTRCIISNIITRNIFCPTCRNPVEEIKYNCILNSTIEKHLQLYPELKQDQEYYKIKDNENNCSQLNKILLVQKQLHQGNLYILRNDEMEGITLCNQICGYAILLILYYIFFFILKKIQGK